MTRRILALMFVLLILTPQQPKAARDRMVYGIATLTTCGAWADYFDAEVGAGSNDFYMKFALKSWIHGFVSGASAARGVGMEFSRMAEAEIVPWITNYCRQNPAHEIDDAADELLAALLLVKK